MKSGDPEPIDELALVMASKRGSAPAAVAIVSEASRWLKSALKGANIAFNYASSEQKRHYGFSAFTIVRKYQGQLTVLDMKIAEIRGAPYVFAEMRTLGKLEGTLFPFFGNLSSDDDRELLLHYIADYVISGDD